MGILAFLIILSLLVFVHELGHFFTARKLGIAVEEFGFGLPPRAFGIKKGATIFSINWIPLGGFVRIKGEQGDNPDDPDSFIGRPVWQRAMVISAGVIMNVIFAAFLLSIGFIIGTPQLLDDANLNGATVVDKEVRVASILDDYPAFSAGVEPGDILLTIDGVSITSVDSMQNYLADTKATTVVLELSHDSELRTKEIDVVPFEDEAGNALSRNVIGVELITTGIVSYSPLVAVGKGIITTGVLLKDITLAFGQVISDVVTGNSISVDLSGPVGIAVITSEITKLGFIYLIQFSALLSLNLAIINFIPFPALDGGRFIFLILEKIKGTSINQRTESTIHTIGFALLMVLILFVTVRDLSHLNVWEKLLSNF
jgi:regulator of sigma E protease